MIHPRLTVIIPTRNENVNLPPLLAQLKAQRGVTLEILVADGGSQDGTLESARRLGATVVTASPGRGAQMNAAARLATGSDLLFLHADSGLRDPHLLQQALTAMDHCRAQHGERCAGHFKLRFVAHPPRQAAIFHYHEEKSGLNRPGCFNGDQGLLLSRRFFAELGAFSEEFPFLEDQELATRITRTGQWCTLPGELETSARRFNQEGVAQRIWLNAMIVVCFHAGFREFLHQAPALYRNQETTRLLRLTPFFRLVRQLNRQAGWPTTWKRWRDIGRHARHSAWQIFFFLDLFLLRHPRHPVLLNGYDRMHHPVTRLLPWDLLAMGVTWLGFMVAWAWFAWRERKEATKGEIRK